MDRYDSSSDKVINFRGFLAQKGIDYRFYEEEDQYSFPDREQPEKLFR